MKPKGRLFIIDFINDENLDKFFGHLHEHSASHTVVHKHGLFFSIYKIFILFKYIGFSSEQMFDMLKAADLQNPQVQVYKIIFIKKIELIIFRMHFIYQNPK